MATTLVASVFLMDSPPKMTDEAQCVWVVTASPKYDGILSTTLPKTPTHVSAVAGREHEIMGLEGEVGASPFA